MIETVNSITVESDSDKSSSRVKSLTQTLASDNNDESNRRVSTVVPVVSDEHDKSSRIEVQYRLSSVMVM